MGLNTVAVLLNDFTHEMEHNPNVGRRMVDAIHEWPPASSLRGSLAGDFHVGKIISMAHADHHQIVIVHGNTGQTIYDATDLPYLALDAMADCLKRHGWSAKPPPKKSLRNPKRLA